MACILLINARANIQHLLNNLYLEAFRLLQYTTTRHTEVQESPAVVMTDNYTHPFLSA